MGKDTKRSPAVNKEKEIARIVESEANETDKWIKEYIGGTSLHRQEMIEESSAVWQGIAEDVYRSFFNTGGKTLDGFL
jgi:hypothetical protein